MKKLRTNYKTDKFAGKRVYKMTTGEGGSTTLDDITKYETVGDIFNADDINTTNAAVNELQDVATSLLEMPIVSLPVSGWGGAPPYTQFVPVKGMKAISTPIPGMLYPVTMTEIQQANIDKSSGMITDMESMDGGLRVTCRFKKPTMDLTIALKGVL